jgi:hypothetical protein
MTRSDRSEQSDRVIGDNLHSHNHVDLTSS